MVAGGPSLTAKSMTLSGLLHQRPAHARLGRATELLLNRTFERKRLLWYNGPRWTQPPFSSRSRTCPATGTRSSTSSGCPPAGRATASWTGPCRRPWRRPCAASAPSSSIRHQAQAINAVRAGPARHPVHRHGQRQDPGLQPPGPGGPPRRLPGPGPVPLSHQGPGPGPTPRPARTGPGRAACGQQALWHLRRRHTPGRPRPPAPRGAASCSPTPTCSTWASCPTTPCGPTFSPTCASSSSTRPTSTGACLAPTWAACCGGCGGSAPATARRPRSSPARPPSPTPASTCSRLTGVEPVVVDDDGAPRGARDFVLWNPPFVDQAQTAAAQRQHRGGAPLCPTGAGRHPHHHLYPRPPRGRADPALRPPHPGGRRSRLWRDRVRAYRAGYRPEQRREIERGLRPGGDLLGVTATSALELGIDIGDLDASVLVGYPGTIASLWQQAGRAGTGHAPRPVGAHRPGQPAGPVLHAPSPGPVWPAPRARAHRPLQSLHPGAAPALRRPRDSRCRGARRRRADLCDALRCPLAHRAGRCRAVAGEQPPAAAQPAAAPTPKPPLPPGLAQGDDEALFGAGFVPAMIALEESGRAGVPSGRGSDRWYPRPGAYPAQKVSLRALAGSRVALLNAAADYRLLEEIEGTIGPVPRPPRRHLSPPGRVVPGARAGPGRRARHPRAGAGELLHPAPRDQRRAHPAFGGPQAGRRGDGAPGRGAGHAAGDRLPAGAAVPRGGAGRGGSGPAGPDL